MRHLTPAESHLLEAEANHAEARRGRAPLSWALLGLIGVLCLTVLAYTRFLSSGFAASDSLPLVESSRLTGPESVVRLFTSPVLAGTTFTLHEVVYRPFVSLTFGLDYLIWGQAAFGYHLTNLALHVVSVAAVWLLLRSLGLARWSGALGAGLFALHPVVVAAVPVIARRDSIVPVAAFTLAAALLVQALDSKGGHRRALLGGSLLLTAIALLSKETAYVAVAMLPVLLVARAWSGGIGAGINAIVLALPHLVLAAVMFILRLIVLGGFGGISDADITEVDLYQYGSLIASYLREQFWAFASLRPITREQWLALVGLLAVGLLLTVLSLPRRQAALVALGAVWIIAFGVFSAIFKVTTLGWLAYFALVGTALVAAAGTEGAVQRLRAVKLPSATLQAVGSAASLATFAIFLVISLSDSALVRDYPQWQLSGDIHDRYLSALNSCMSSIPDVWDEEYVSLQRVPAAFQDGRIETDMLGVTIVEQYTAETALRLAFPEREMLVYVGSTGTLHSNEMQFMCAALPHGLEFTAIY